MKEIEIKDISGKTRFSTPINKGAKGKFTLMKEDYIVIPFSVSEPIYFKLGDYVDLSGVLDDSLGGLLSKVYEIVEVPKPTFNTSTCGYDYQLRLDAYYWKWKNKKFKYTPEHAGYEASWSLTAPLDVQLGVFLRNLKALGYTHKGTDFQFSIDSTVENKAVAMTYDNMSLLDALFSMASKEHWNCDCWITDNIIHFGRNEYGDAVKIELGVEASTMTRSESKGTYATRIYAFGSTRNIPSNYRPIDEQTVVNGVVQRRLMLPADTPYIDVYPDMSEEEAIEDIVVFDDVYPRRVGTMSDVKTVDRAITGENGEEVGTFKAYQYKDTGLIFKDEYIIEGQELEIIFQSGKLNGLKFGVIFEPEGTSKGSQIWEIKASEDYGRLLPDELMCPENGDKYILSGFNIQLVSDQYIPEAEQELKEKALKYAEQCKKDDGTYNTTLDSVWVYEDKLKRFFEFGQKVNLINKAFFENGRESRILGWEFNLDIPWDSPTYVIGESMPYSRIGDIEDKVDSLTYKGQTYTGGGNGSSIYVIRANDMTAPSDSNVFSGRRSLLEFISKKFNDTVLGVITFMKTIMFRGGAVFGKDGYAEGMAGFGAKVDDRGHAEVESLTSRRFIETPELRYNRVDVKVGDKWRAPGAGVIESVDTETKICTLKLEKGEIGAVAVGDICMGIFHSLIPSDNATEDTDDSKGNRTFAGFCTVYFTIIEVIGSRNEQFKYQLRPVSSGWKFSFHPFEQMNFVAYGSFTNEERQTSVYETRTYSRMLWKQNTWEIGKHNIAKQSGDLTNLNIFGMELTGYSEYLNSVYFTGEITQVKPDGTPVITANDRGAYLNNTHYYYYDRVSHNGCIWLCINEDGTDTEPSDNNPNWLKQVDKGAAGQDGTSFRILGSKNDQSELPTNGNEIGDGYLIKGDLWVWSGTEWNNAGNIQGPAGESVQNMGGWYEGLFVPYLGVVRMGNATFMCVRKEGTYNPPYYTLLDNQGNRLKSEKGYILTGEMNNAEYQLIAADGNDGQDGMDGLQGADGKDGIPGKDGADGKTTYFHIKYSENENGYPMTETPSKYIGTYVDFEEKDSEDYTKYAWARFEGLQGEKGDQGIPGLNGTDGKTYYLHIKYSNDNGLTFTGNNGEDPGDYIGQYTDLNPQDSNNPKDYKWAVIKGEKGDGYIQIGAWYEGLLVPKLGVVTMGGNSFAAKEATRNPPMFTLMDNHGNRLKSEQGYILTGEINYNDYLVLAMKGEDGKDGEPGKDGIDGKPGKDGEQGLQGCIVRDSEWAIGVEYRNDSGITDGSLEIRYIDVALVRNDAAETGWDAYQCLRTHVSSSSITYTNTSYWKKFGANVGAIFTSLIISKNAKIKFLSGNEITIQKSDGTITAGMSGRDTGRKIRFWAGSSNPDTAPFRVSETGEMWATNAHIQGEVIATSGSFVNMSFKTKNDGERIEINAETNSIDLISRSGKNVGYFKFYNLQDYEGSALSVRDIKGDYSLLNPSSLLIQEYISIGNLSFESKLSSRALNLYNAKTNEVLELTPSSIKIGGKTGITRDIEFPTSAYTKGRLSVKNGIIYSWNPRV